MDCEEVRNRLADHLTGSADQVSDEVSRHLTSCASCREEAGALEETWSALAGIPLDPPDSAVMRGRFNQMVEAYQAGLGQGRLTGVGRSTTGWLARAWSWQSALQLGCAVLLLGAGVVAGRLSRPAQPMPGSPDIAELRRELRGTKQLVMLSLMQQASASERLKGVGWSREIDQPGAEVVGALLDSLTHDPNVNVRLACVDALMPFSGRPGVRLGMVQALNQVTSPMVQIALIDFVVEVGEKEATDTLRRLSEDTALDEAVRQRASWGLGQLG